MPNSGTGGTDAGLDVGFSMQAELRTDTAKELA